MAGRGELGFIANTSSRIANRNFFGSPGHPSKKGATGLSQTSKLNQEEPSNFRTECTLDNMISKRTEWLETQQRRMAATINETRSETNILDDKLSEIDGGISRLKSNKDESIQLLYNEIQSVYGRVDTKTLMALPNITTPDNANETTELQEFKMDSRWVVLVYPMQGVGSRMFMRAKSVDKHTGQLSMTWVLVYETTAGEETRYVQEFSMTSSHS